MSIRDDQTPDKSPASAVWPPRVPGLRALTKQELEELAMTLEKPADRELGHWVLTAISNSVKLSTLPSPAQAAERLKRFARQGREWIDQIDADPIKALLAQKLLQENTGSLAAVAEHKTNIQDLKMTMARICKLADTAAVGLGRFVRRGGKRSTSPALTAFIGTMIGIAKSNGIRPSTPQRSMYSRRPPAFFVFVKRALSIAEDVIESSDITDDQKWLAMQSLRYVSDDALIRIIERKRGLIGDYHETQHGSLILDTSRQRKAGPSRSGRG